MVNREPIVRAIVITAILAVLGACASKPPEDVTLKGSLQAVEDVNPDSNGRASPLVVKIYQLKSKDKFDLADFFPLFDQAEATLGADMLAVEDIMLTPGEYRSYEGEFDPQTRYIGVVAAYRDIHQAQWKDLVEMPEKSVLKFLKRGALVIKAEKLAINVSAGD